jgi:hypothetical protein
LPWGLGEIDGWSILVILTTPLLGSLWVIKLVRDCLLDAFSLESEMSTLSSSESDLESIFRTTYVFLVNMLSYYVIAYSYFLFI